MNKHFSKFNAAEYLHNDEDMRLYLEACIEEDSGDGGLIRSALQDIARSQNVSALARKVGVSREGLYNALSERGNPSFMLVLKLAKALGLRLSLTPDLREPHIA